MDKKEHPYAKVLRWIADGETIELRKHSGNTHWTEEHPATVISYVYDGMEIERFRLKPRTININGREVPEPIRVAPASGARYWMPLHSGTESEFDATSDTWSDHPVDRKRLARGICHASYEAAEAHAHALLSFTTMGASHG